MKKVIIETSARHVHLSQDDLNVLFGEGYNLTVKKELSQPGQFACVERVDVIGPKRELKGVSVLGPTRKQTQVELSLTDARSIGIKAPIRESGDLKDSAGCIIRGPEGEIELKEGVIIAKRHIHATVKDALELGLKDKDVVSVKITGTGRDTILGDVVVRVSDNYAFFMHVDTDESNAANLSGVVEGEIIK